MIFIRNVILIILYCFSIMFSRMFSTKGLPKGCLSLAISQTHDQNPRGVLAISSDGDDRMEPKVKTQKNP